MGNFLEMCSKKAI